MPSSDAPVPLDTRLLHGLVFSCRPDCGLCCYAEPRLEVEEASQLLKIAPEVDVRRVGREAFLASRPDGGACQFLEGHRCRVHGHRPHPCREFPLTAHLGHRIQVTAVLSCPGIDVERFLLNRVPSTEAPAEGVDDELLALRERLGPEARRRWTTARRRGEKVERRLTSEVRWVDDETVRRTLTAEPPWPSDRDYPVEEPPDVEDGLERLPLFWDAREGPVAFARGLGGWQALELAPEGGYRPLGVFSTPTRPPEMDPGARALLGAYLAYWLSRDAFLSTIQLGMLDAPGGSVTEWAAADLREIAAQTAARAYVRATMRRGVVGTLGVADIVNGIRAVDQDWLDRPSWGDRL